jgi:hypothetical protein
MLHFTVKQIIEEEALLCNKSHNIYDHFIDKHVIILTYMKNIEYTHTYKHYKYNNKHD